MQRKELQSRYRQLRLALPARFDARKKFAEIGAGVMHWHMEAEDWPRRSTQLLDLFDTLEREDREPPVPIIRKSPPLPISLDQRARLGFWDRREMLRQLKRARLQVQAEAHLEMLNAKIEKRGARLPDPVGRLVELEREVYRRFGLEP